MDKLTEFKYIGLMEDFDHYSLTFEFEGDSQVCVKYNNGEVAVLYEENGDINFSRDNIPPAYFPLVDRIISLAESSEEGLRFLKTAKQLYRESLRIPERPVEQPEVTEIITEEDKGLVAKITETFKRVKQDS